MSVATAKVETERTLMNVTEAATYLGISENVARKLAARNELPGMVRIGEKRIKVHKPTLDKWLSEQAVGG